MKKRSAPLSEEEPKPKQRKTFELKLTNLELQHIRDLFSIVLPPEMKTTVSQALALSQNRVLVEAALWQKFIVSFKEANLPLGDDAPDFVVAASAAPPIALYELAHEQAMADEEEEAEECDVFCHDKESKETDG